MSDSDLYGVRFSDRDVAAKDEVWREVTRWLRPWILAPVLDIACDRGYFIRHLGGERWATDIRDVSGYLGPDVRFIQAPGLHLDRTLPLAYFGTIFMSNYLEHLRSRDEVVEQMRIAFRLLRPGGRVIVLQPNIRYAGAAYWDFIDHHVELTDRSLAEAASLAGFETEYLVAQFLPYSTKGRLPSVGLLARWYLRVPVAWRLFGGQALYVGRRPDEGP